MYLRAQACCLLNKVPAARHARCVCEQTLFECAIMCLALSMCGSLDIFVDVFFVRMYLYLRLNLSARGSSRATNRQTYRYVERHSRPPIGSDKIAFVMFGLTLPPSHEKRCDDS